MNEQKQVERLLTDAQVAELLGGLHPKTVQKMARTNDIPAIRIGRYWRYRPSDLIAWIEVQSSGQLARV